MLSKKVLKEICDILKSEGRDDLVARLVDDNDHDYVPPTRYDSDSYSDDEGSATDESISFEVDDEGFMSLKE